MRRGVKDDNGGSAIERMYQDLDENGHVEMSGYEAGTRRDWPAEGSVKYI